MWREPCDNLWGLICRQTDVKLCCAPRVSQIIITKSSDRTENEINIRVSMHCYHMVCIVSRFCSLQGHDLLTLGFNSPYYQKEHSFSRLFEGVLSNTILNFHLDKE